MGWSRPLKPVTSLFFDPARCTGGRIGNRQGKERKGTNDKHQVGNRFGHDTPVLKHGMCHFWSGDEARALIQLKFAHKHAIAVFSSYSSPLAG